MVRLQIPDSFKKKRNNAMGYCEECGDMIAEDARYCDRCYYGSSLLQSKTEVLLWDTPEHDISTEEPCDHEYHEIGHGMAQCIFCGAIED
jgi:hypothetical protein